MVPFEIGDSPLESGQGQRIKNEANVNADDATLIDYLEELAESFDIEIHYEVIRQDEDLPFVPGGLCLLKGKYVLIINSRASAKDRIWALATAVKHFNLDQIYIRPVLRELLNKIPDQKPFISSSGGIRSRDGFEV